jgi:hypothetical protein
MIFYNPYKLFSKSADKHAFGQHRLEFFLGVIFLYIETDTMVITKEGFLEAFTYNKKTYTQLEVFIIIKQLYKNAAATQNI